MLRIVIADDEERIRLGLAKMITAAGSDYRIAGLFASGGEVLEQLDALEFDLLITDIKMPGMSGMQLVEQLRERRPELQVVVVSGFSEFDYARQAMRLGAADYLIKPIDKPELYRLLDKLRLAQAHARQRERDRRREALAAALTGRAEDAPARLRQLAQLLPPTVKPSSCFGFIVIRSETPLAADAAERELPAFPGQPELALLERVALTTHELCVVYAVEALPAERLLPLGRQLAERIMAALPGTLAAGVGAAAGVDGWPAGCREAQRASRRALYSAARTDVAVGGAPAADKPMLAAVRVRIDKDLRAAAQVLDTAKLLSSLRAVFGELAALRPELDEIAELCAAMVYVLHREIAEFAAAVVRRHGEGFDWIAGVKLGVRLAAIESRFVGMVRELLADIGAERERSGNRIVEQVKRMLEAEYDRDIELGRLADRVYLTPSYLSKLFKTETGATLTDYLIGIRMTRAKQLLKEHAEMKTYEVGERVGYADPAYFHKIFKKMVGVTPKEYKDQMRFQP